MSSSSYKHKNIELDNLTYNILMSAGKESICILLLTYMKMLKKMEEHLVDL